MKKVLMILPALILAVGLNAQNRPSPPAEAKATIKGTEVTINYSQPSVKERQIWGGLVPYGSVWRTGANEATWIELSQNVSIEGKSLKAGKYGLFTIPGEGEWTIIFNETWDQWGAYNYDKSKDVLRVTVKPSESTDHTEQMTFEIDDNGKVNLLWDKLAVSFKID